MASLLAPETFEFFATYLLAGYIVIIVRSRFIVGLRPKPAELVIEAIIFSLINQLVTVGIVGLSSFVGLTDWLSAQGLFNVPDGQLPLFLKNLVLPALIGALLGYNLSAGWRNTLLRRLSLPVTHPVQRAHDYAFGHERAPGLVIVTYDDGTVIRGYFGENSLAASDADRSDLYLERLYSEDKYGQWIDLEPQRSALISLHGLRSIEFLDAEG